MGWCRLPQPRVVLPTPASCRIVAAEGSLHRLRIVVVVVTGATTAQSSMFPLSHPHIARSSSLHRSALALSLALGQMGIRVSVLPR
jgi:hypothetical protein